MPLCENRHRIRITEDTYAMLWNIQHYSEELDDVIRRIVIFYRKHAIEPYGNIGYRETKYVPDTKRKKS